MNAIAISRTASGRPSKLMGAFVFFFLLVVIAVVTIPIFNQAKTPTIVIRGGSAHGDHAHGDQGPQARNCLKRHGTSYIYLEPDGFTFHFLCQGDSGEWFGVIAAKDGEEYVEKTALEPQDGVLQKIIDWLTQPTSVEGKGATIYKQISTGTTVIFK